MPPSSSRKPLDITIKLPQDLQDMGYKELVIRRQNGILITVDDTRFLFTFDLNKYDKTVSNLQDALIQRSVDDRIATIICAKITDVPVRYNFNDPASNDLSSHTSTANEETKIILDEIAALLQKYADLPYEVWRQELVNRYRKLRQVIKDNIPQSWESLECVLTAKGILHIKDISLPLLVVIVGNPSTWKTVGISN
jgi:hypothetical protein